MNKNFAVLVDGGFFSRKLYSKIKKTPEVEDVMSAIHDISQSSALANLELLRVYYYDSRPASGTLKNPVSGETVNLAKTDVYRRNQAFLDKLELQANVALRLGDLSANGWKLKSKTLKDPQLGNRPLSHEDFAMDLEQKGVDLRIGLDIARLSLRSLVHTVVVVTGDSDLIPAFKFARREGIRVVLSHMGHGVKRELRAHTDLVLEEFTPSNDGSAPPEASDAERSAE